MIDQMNSSEDFLLNEEKNRKIEDRLKEIREDNILSIFFLKLL